MSTVPLFLTTGSGAAITAADLDELRTRDLPKVRLVRGRRMRTRAALLDEMAAALQFPATFGGNWDALADCLADLQWLGGPGLVVLAVSDADQVGADEDGMLAVLAAVLAAVPMQVLLGQADGEPDPAWNAAGLTVTDLR